MGESERCTEDSQLRIGTPLLIAVRRVVHGRRVCREVPFDVQDKHGEKPRSAPMGIKYDWSSPDWATRLNSSSERAEVLPPFLPLLETRSRVVTEHPPVLAVSRTFASAHL